MLSEDLQALSQDMSLNFDAQNSAAYGMYKGFAVFIKALSERNAFIVTTWARKGALTSVLPEKWFEDYLQDPENSYIKSHSVQQYSISTAIEGTQDSSVNFTRLNTYIYDIMGYYSQNYFSDSCASCGSSIGVDFVDKQNGIKTRLCRMCKEKEIDTRDFVAEKQSRPDSGTSIPPLSAPSDAQPIFTAPEPPFTSPIQSEPAFTNSVQPQPQFGQPTQPQFGQPTQPQYGQPTQPQYGQPTQPQFGQPTQPQYGQPTQPQFGQPTQPQFGQPTQSQFGQPTQPQYGQPATPVAPAFTDDFDRFMQGSSSAPADYQNNMQAAYVTPMEQSISNAVVGSQGSMDAIDPNTAPEGTGYSTAESLAELQPPTQREQLPPPTVMPNDFRSQPEQPYNQPINRNQGMDGFTTYNPNYTGGISPMPMASQAVYTKPNHLAALAGSLLFTLIGAVVWSLLGYMGIISSLGAVLLGFLCVIGYKIFGKTYDLIGLISGFVMICLAVLCSEIFINCIHMYNNPTYVEVLEYMGYDSFGYTFFHFFDLLTDMDHLLDSLNETSDLMSSFLGDLALSYLFALIGYFSIAIPEFRRNR